MLKTIALRNVRQVFGEKPVFEGINFKCTEREKICIVGENGVGKSTLLRIIAGELEPESGIVERNGHVRAQYVAQEFPQEDMALTIAEYVAKHADVGAYKRAFATGAELGFPLEKHQEKVCAQLSGGQQKILALSTALAAQPDFILLDEPENHLDIVSRLELIAHLQDYRGGVLFISHDRLLIDSLAEKVAEMTKGQIHISEGGYEEYVEHRLARIKGLQRAFDTEEKRIRKLRETVVILGQKAYRGKDIAAYRKYKAELESLKAKHKETGRADDRRTSITLAKSGPGFHEGRLLCRVKKGAFQYEGQPKETFRNANLEIRTGSHIVLLGRNGSGKSTFLKCLMGALPFTEGEVVWTPDLRVAYFDQHTEFDPERTALEIVTKELNLDDESGRAALGAMKFDKETMDIEINGLSGGQRMRLRFALTFGAKPDVLILDEPTNHLDEVTWEILLNAVNSSKSTILLVTHDHEFIDGMQAKKFWMLHKGTVHERHKELPELIEELRA